MLGDSCSPHRAKNLARHNNYADKMEAAAEGLGFVSCLAASGAADEYNYYQEHNGADY